MTTLSIFLGFHSDRWRYVGPSRFWTAMGIALGGSIILTFNRFGGLVAQAPRAFVRFALIGVWGWIMISIAIWIVGRVVLGRWGPDPGYAMPPANNEVLFSEDGLSDDPDDDDTADDDTTMYERADGTAPTSILAALTAVGYAHQPLVFLGAFLVTVSGLFQLRGPGLIVAVLTIGVWLPALMIVAVRHLFRLSLPLSAAVVALPYAIWALVVGRHFFNQLGHVL